MKENKHSPHEEGMVVVSSEEIRRTMQPRLRTMLTLHVINDNIGPKSSAMKQIWLVGAAAAMALMVTIYF